MADTPKRYDHHGRATPSLGISIGVPPAGFDQRLTEMRARLNENMRRRWLDHYALGARGSSAYPGLLRYRPNELQKDMLASPRVWRCQSPGLPPARRPPGRNDSHD